MVNVGLVGSENVKSLHLHSSYTSGMLLCHVVLSKPLFLNSLIWDRMGRNATPAVTTLFPVTVHASTTQYIFEV